MEEQISKILEMTEVASTYSVQVASNAIVWEAGLSILFWSIGAIISCFIWNYLVTKIKEVENELDELTPPQMLLLAATAITSSLLLIGAAAMGAETVSMLFNPEWYAIKQILEGL